MSDLSDNIKRIAQTAETNAKIKIIPFTDKAAIGSQRGIGTKDPTPDVCSILYSTRDNTYDFEALLAGTAGPTLGDKCSKLDSITGLTDFDTSLATASFGAVVNLVVKVNGIFT